MPEMKLTPPDTRYTARKPLPFVILLTISLVAWLGATITAPTLVNAKEQGRKTEAQLHARMNKLIRTGGVIVGDGSGNGELFVHGNGQHVPASIIKLATALAAIDRLGEDYRFPTEVYLDENRNLYLRGLGDPFLVSEEWRLIAGELAALGVFKTPLNNLVLDNTAFDKNLEVDGATTSLNPYDARLGALTTNFNTVFVRVSRNGGVTSAEPQTPLTPLAKERGRSLAPGKHRINFSQNAQAGLRYTGEVTRAIFGEQGAQFTSKVRVQRVPSKLRDAKPLLIHRSSKPLKEGIQAMMRFSNNFIANQIVLGMVLETQGAPAKLSSGVALIRQYLTDKLKLNPKKFHLEEGSGLSRQTKITLPDMLTIVRAFTPHADLLKPFGKAPHEARAKTGTLTGVSTLAGYLPGTNLPFVIILNQHRNTRWAVYKTLYQNFGKPNPQGALPKLPKPE